jgi:hypothetical protein
MKTIGAPRKIHHQAGFSVFLIAAALIAGAVSCAPRSQDLQIRTWYDLDAVRSNLAGHHTLMNDLDSTTSGYEELASPTANEGKGWQPIGYGYWAGPQVLGEMFRGTFDGQRHEIRDLYITDPDGCEGGLFGFVGEGGVIEDIALMNATVTGCERVGSLARLGEGTVRTFAGIGLLRVAGGLVGYNRGSVSNCYVTGNVAGDGEVGGLVGDNSGTVSNSYFGGNVTGDDYVGGLVGDNSGTVSNSYSSGSVTGGNITGGLTGSNEGTVSNCFWDMQTSGQTTSAGGIGKTTAEMKSIVTFTRAGWDIMAVTDGETNTGYVWNIVNGVAYPFLSWQSV